MRSRKPIAFVVLLAASALPASRLAGKAAYDAFTAWRSGSAIRGADWSDTITQYRNKLKNDGVAEVAINRAIQAIEAYGEAELYDGVYAGPPTFNTEPNKLLAEAVQGRSPGSALDIATGQGRNAVYLATKGWNVTGFDVSAVGLAQAGQLANSRSVKIKTVLSSDEDFEFGTAQWDLIAMIYAIEKRSVYRIRSVLKPQGLVVIEAGHKSASGAPFEYESKELLHIFEGFRILRYEETTNIPDWGKEPVRLVRLIAEKPR